MSLESSDNVSHENSYRFSALHTVSIAKIIGELSKIYEGDVNSEGLEPKDIEYCS